MPGVNSKIVSNLDSNITNNMKNENRDITKIADIEKTISNNIEDVELDLVNFADDFYDAIGSNRLSKETGMKCIYSLGLSNFIEEKDIKKVEKRGSNGKNVLITLKDGSSYLFVNETGKTYLSSITDSKGRCINFGKNFEEFINKFRKWAPWGDPLEIKDISLFGGEITFNMGSGNRYGEEYTFDMETKKLRRISLGRTTYSAEDINDMLKEVSERLANYLNDGSTMEDIMNKYNLDLNIDNISMVMMTGEGEIRLRVGDMSLSIFDDGNSKSYTIYSDIDGIVLPEDENLTL